MYDNLPITQSINILSTHTNPTYLSRWQSKLLWKTPGKSFSPSLHQILARKNPGKRLARSSTEHTHIHTHTPKSLFVQSTVWLGVFASCLSGFIYTFGPPPVCHQPLNKNPAPYVPSLIFLFIFFFVGFCLPDANCTTHPHLYTHTCLCDVW